MQVRFSVPAAAALVVMLPAEALAGMPVVDLTDVAHLRLRAISFFALVLLLSAFGIQRIWNSLRPEFPSLPVLSYRRALALVALWGLVFLLVLTMISGARELMTPGAWKKDGATYKLADQEPERRERLERLRSHLWSYAQAHGGDLPSQAGASEIPDAAWRVIDDARAARYVYAGGSRPGVGEAPIAWEPVHYGADRWALLASGAVVRRPASDLESPPGAGAR